MFWFYRRRVTGQLQTGEFLMNGRRRKGWTCRFAEGVRTSVSAQAIVRSNHSCGRGRLERSGVGPCCGQAEGRERL